MKIILEKVLAFFARRILNKYQPQIIGITGSLGKTSAANAIFAVLSSEYNVRQNIKNYNNEIGLPLTVIYAESGNKSVFKWLGVFYKAIKLLIVKDTTYPEMLVLEMGADMVGDLDYLINIAQPDFGVLTSVSETHLKPTNPKAKNEAVWFKDIKGVLKEKQKIVTRLKENGIAILNFDDENVISLRDKISLKIFTYGFKEGAEVIASEVLFIGLEQDFCQTDHEWDCKVWGTNFKVSYNGSTVPVFLPQCFGKQPIYAALAAISVGLALGMNLVDIAESLRDFKPAKGRMNIITGIKHSLIIDDTYNAPAARAVISGLEVMQSITLPEARNKIAVLGDILELGEKNDSAHREVGLKIAEMGIDYLVTVGNLAQLISSSAVEAGLANDHVWHFDKADQAGRFVQDLLQEGDLLFVKGSQSIRMEKVVKEIMAEPEKAGELLVRQTPDWLSR